DEDAEAAGRRAIELARASGEPALEAWARVALGRLALDRCRPDHAAFEYGAALDLFRSVDNIQGEAAALLSLSTLKTDMGDPELAERYARAASARIESAGDLGGFERVQVSIGLGFSAHAAGRLDDALGHYEEALDVSRNLADASYEAMATFYGALVRF